MSTASLDAAAAARKERLSQLKSLKRKAAAAAPASAPDAEEAVPAAAAAPAQATKDVSHLLSGRNYDVEDRAPKMGFVSDPKAGQETLEDAAAKIAEETRRQRAEAEKEDKPIDLFNLQPKKPNWDLKRDVDKRLERLNRRTDAAIARLIRARIAEQKQKAAQKGGGAGDGGAEGRNPLEKNLAQVVAEREKEADDLDGDVDDGDE